MKTYVSCFLLFLVLMPPAVAHAGKTLTDLDQVDIVVENLTKFEKEIGLSEESLRSLVLVAVKRDIPQIKIQNTAGAYIYVRITSTQINEYGVACFVSVEMRRPVRVLRDKDDEVVGRTLASVWGKGAILTGSRTTMASRIREEISEELTEFSAEYYRQNP